jgi:prevent-host-death family protein
MVLYMMYIMHDTEADMSRVSVAEARERFSELIALVAYKGERVTIERKGKPMAALVSLEDLAVLEEAAADRAVRREKQLAALQEAAALRGRILARRGGELLPDSVETINELREGGTGE